jgi:4-carboxymuconolactone decarboxylase
MMSGVNEAVRLRPASASGVDLLAEGGPDLGRLGRASDPHVAAPHQRSPGMMFSAVWESARRTPVCEADGMTDRLPEIYTRFRRDYPTVAAAQDAVAEAVAATGNLDERTLRLVKLGIAVGALAEGSVRSNTRRALAAGASADDVRQVALCAITTRGFPAAIAALGWIDEVIGGTA